MIRSYLVVPCLLILAACSEETGKTTSGSSSGSSSGNSSGSSSGNPPDEPGIALEIPVPATGRTYVALKKPEIVTPKGDATMDPSWDLAFEGYDVFTNSGASGSGLGGAFGPLDAATYDEGVAPQIPFLTKDEPGGAFGDFWAYDPSVHQLWVRYHVFGVREGDKLWKVQILGYYGEQQGAPVSALYRLRWAEVNSSGAQMTQNLVDVDGTAGGAQAPADAPSECLDLGTGARVMHTPVEARAAKDWHLCFRRAVISVNGEIGGPRGITAVDLHESETKGEKLAVVKTRTDASELPRFDAVGYAELTAPSLIWRGDRVFSAFSNYWVNPLANPPAPENHSWFVTAADESASYLLVFKRFDGATKDGPGTVVMRVRPEGL